MGKGKIVREVLEEVAPRTTKTIAEEVFPEIQKNTVRRITSGLEYVVDRFGKKEIPSHRKIYQNPVKPQSTINSITSGKTTSRHLQLDISPNVPNYIDEVNMNVEAGRSWLDKERPELLNRYFKRGSKKAGDLEALDADKLEGMLSDVQSQINSLGEIPVKSLTTTQKSLKKRLLDRKKVLTQELKYYDSTMNTGPAMFGDPNDIIMYGKKGMSADNPPSIMADLEGKVEGWTPQAHKSTDWHHWWLNELTTPINRRMRELIRLKKARPNDELNLHAWTWKNRRTFGSRVSGGVGLENTAHQAGHKVGSQQESVLQNLIADTYRIEPSTTPFSSKPLNKTTPPNNIIVDGKDVKISTADWKLIQEADLDVNRYDAERIMAVYKKTDNLPFAIQQLKEFKFDRNGDISNMYELLGPDNKSEMQRLVAEINSADSAAELLAIAQDIDRLITQPMSKIMESANEYALNIGGRELMKYTHKPKEFWKDYAEWYMRKLELDEFKYNEKLRQLQ